MVTEQNYQIEHDFSADQTKIRYEKRLHVPLIIFVDRSCVDNVALNIEISPLFLISNF